MKLDKRRKYYCILDTETCTLPEATFYSEKDTIALIKPLVYDIGWCITDKKGIIYKERNFLVSEIFSNVAAFNTAYYSNKRHYYIDKMQNNEITVKPWKEIIDILEKDLSFCEAVGAYNANFDFKKAIPYTEKYINAFYSHYFNSWYENELETIKRIANKEKYKSNKKDNNRIFSFHETEYNLFDIWSMVCKTILNTNSYKKECIKNSWVTSTGKYFSTNAENAYRFVNKDNNFIESHTALDDSKIESFLFSRAVKKNKNQIDFENEYFPFRILGMVKDFQNGRI